MLQPPRKLGFTSYIMISTMAANRIVQWSASSTGGCPRAYRGLGKGSGFRKRVGQSQFTEGPIPTRRTASSAQASWGGTRTFL